MTSPFSEGWLCEEVCCNPASSHVLNLWPPTEVPGDDMARLLRISDLLLASFPLFPFPRSMKSITYEFFFFTVGVRLFFPVRTPVCNSLSSGNLLTFSCSEGGKVGSVSFFFCPYQGPPFSGFFLSASFFELTGQPACPAR